MAAGDTFRKLTPQDQLILNAAGALVGVKNPNANGLDLRVDQPAAYLPYILAQSGVPTILPSSGSSNASGQITLTTALPYQPTGTVGLYLPAGVVTAGSQGSGAGVYQVTFSSTTVCQLAGTGVVTANAAYTQTTAAVVVSSVTVPGGAMGANGGLRIQRNVLMPNNANSKTGQMTIGGQVIGGWAGTTITLVAEHRMVRNRGVQSAQSIFPDNFAATGGNTFSTVNATVDTSVNQVLNHAFTLAVATDYMVLDGYTVEILPAP